MLLESIIARIPIWVLKLIYPLEESKRTPDRKVEVLCLGLSRTGTDSLRTALHDLDYQDIYHGFFLIDEGIHGAVQWERLSRAKWGAAANPAGLGREEFDKVLGSCMAVTDAPSATFGVELLRAYPEAKVVLNRRADVDAWYRSHLNTVDKLYRSWPEWTRQYFESETFWVARNLYWGRMQFDFDFSENGKEYYARHYEQVEAELRRQGRTWLDWTVQDGWTPLCQFLGKPIPDVPFPSGNDVAGFGAKRGRIHQDRIERAKRNMRTALVVMTATLTVGAGLLLRRLYTA